MTPEGIWVNKSKNDVRQIQRVLIMLILSPWEYRDKEGFVLWRPLWLWQIKKDEASIFREFLFLFLLLKFLLEAICRVSTDLSEWKLSCSTKGQLWQSVLTQALRWLLLTVKCTHSVTDWTEHTPHWKTFTHVTVKTFLREKLIPLLQKELFRSEQSPLVSAEV